MSTTVTTIDLDMPLHDLELPPRATGAQILLRHAQRPVGMIRLKGRDRIVAARIAEAIIQQASAYRPKQWERSGERISIVVCTHERPDDLQRCLEALRPAALDGHEIIVVDNAPRTNRTAEVCSRFPFRYILEPRQGLDFARNAGLQAAHHAIVAYTDDDAVIDPEWPAMIAAPFVDPNVGCTTGLVMPLELETEAQEKFETYCLNRRVFIPRTFTAHNTPPASAGVAGMGANMAVRRELAMRIGEFDVRLDGGMPTKSGGDTDMFARILDSGASIVYTPDALVWHRHRREMDALYHCIFGYGVGLYSFLSKRLFEQGDWRSIEIGLRWWIGPIAKAAWRSIRNQVKTGNDLIIREALGAFLGPYALYQANQQLRQTAQAQTQLSVEE